MTTNANPQTSAGLGCTGMDRAIDRIRDEMAKDPKNSAIQMIGEVLTELLRRHPTLADRLLAEGKSLSKAMDAMKAEARKQQSGGCACVDALTGMKIVLNYYDISTILERELVNAILDALTPGARVEDKPADTSTADELDLDSMLREV